MVTSKRFFNPLTLAVVGALITIGLIYAFDASAQQEDDPTNLITGLAYQSILTQQNGAAADRINVHPADVTINGDYAFGLASVHVDATMHGTPELILFMARRSSNGWQLATENTSQFTNWLGQAPTSLVNPQARQTLTTPAVEGQSAAAGGSLLSLPFATGETWNLTGGPHACCNGDRTGRGALDLAWGYGTGKVRAAREGIAWRAASCPNFVRVDHADGWQTGYYHLVNEQVANGQSVARGQYLGDEGNGIGCGGWSSGPHVHFSLRLNEVAQTFNGHNVGGWTVSAGSAQYQGCMRRVRDGFTVCAPNAPVYNDGAIGSGSGIPVAPVDTELVTNGNFSGGFIGWNTDFDTDYTVNDGVLNWYSPAGGRLATIFQTINYTIPQDSAVQLITELGNSSDTAKKVRVHVQAYENETGLWDEGLLVCEFNIPPNTPLKAFTARRNIDTSWTRARVWIEGYPPDGDAAIRTDNVELRRYDDLGITETECFQGRPGRPGSVVRLSPTAGAEISTSPEPHTIQWQALEDALWYHVYIAQGSEVFVDEWLEGVAVCDETSICTMPDDLSKLDNGEYSWWMVAQNDNGLGEYDELRFTVRNDPPQTIKREPPTSAFDQSLTWTADPTAEWYHIYLATEGYLAHDNWHEGAAVCDEEGVCSIDMPTLLDGDFDWWMAAWGAGSMGTYDNVPFTIDETAPEPVEIISPSGGVPSGNITISWQMDANALWYHVYIVRPDVDDYNKWHDAKQVCGEITCSVIVNLPSGEYELWMGVWGPGGLADYRSRQFATIN